MDRRKIDRRTRASSEVYIPDIEEILHILQKHKKMILVLTFIPSLLGFIYLVVKPDVYKATASVLLEERDLTLASFPDILPSTKFDNLTVPTQVKVITSTRLIHETIENLGLHENKNGEIDEGGKAPVHDKGRYEILSNFEENLRITPQAKSRVIEISFQSRDPVLAAKIANTHTKQYVFSQVQAKKEDAKELNEWVSKQIGALKTENLIKSQAGQQFRAQNGMVLGKNSQELVYQQISDIATQLIPIETRELDLLARREVLEASGEDGNSHALIEVVESKLIQDLKSRASIAAQNLQSLRGAHGENHPDIVAAKKELTQVKSDINREVDNIKNSISNELATVTKQKELLENKLVNIQKHADQLREKQITLQSLELEEAASRKVLDNFLGRAEEIKSQIDFTKADVRIVSLADVPVKPAGSGKFLTMIIIVIFSGLFALGVVFLRISMDAGIESAADVKRLLNLRLIGILPQTKTPLSLVLNKKRSDYLEEIKRIYIQISAKKELKTILITSAVPD